MTIQHVIEGAGAPTSVPPSKGAHYVNTANGDQYLAKGTANAADWVLVTGNYVTGQQLTDGLSGKADKVAGKGFSTEDYTTADKQKLASLEGSHYRGTYLSLAALQAAIAVGVPGDYADVDAGPGDEVTRFVWDANNSAWIDQKSAATPLTAAQVKDLYESNADTNAFTDADKAKLTALEPGGGGGGGAVAGDLVITSRTLTTGYLELDGSVHSRAAYPTLADFPPVGSDPVPRNWSRASAIPGWSSGYESTAVGLSRAGVIVIIATVDAVQKIFRSEDKGATFAVVATIASGGKAVAVHTNNSGKWWVEGAGQSELVSTDDGLTWAASYPTRFGAGLEFSNVSMWGDVAWKANGASAISYSTDYFETIETIVPLAGTVPNKAAVFWRGQFYITEFGVPYVRWGEGDYALVTDASGMPIDSVQGMCVLDNSFIFYSSQWMYELNENTSMAERISQFIDPSTWEGEQYIRGVTPGYTEHPRPGDVPDETYEDYYLIVHTDVGAFYVHRELDLLNPQLHNYSVEQVSTLGGYDFAGTSNIGVGSRADFLVKLQAETGELAVYIGEGGYGYDTVTEFKLPNSPQPEGFKAYIKL